MSKTINKTKPIKTVYAKIQDARVKLQNLKLKKSGKNQNISYYELADFLPAINKLCLENGLTTNFSITTIDGLEEAILVITDVDDPEQNILFTCPTVEVSLPRGQAIQGLGAKITYLRRYMMMTAFEIIESEFVDSINRELTDTIEAEDIAKIEKIENVEQLTKLFNEMKSKYKVRLITPLFTEQKAKFDVKVEKKEAKPKKKAV